MLKPGILLADDHTFVLEEFLRILEEQYELVGATGTGAHSWGPRRPRSPTSSSWIFPCRCSWHRCDGTAENIYPQAKVIIVTMHADTDYVRSAFEAGA
jgi:DNA-binding NarL/FixJ family response regulator